MICHMTLGNDCRNRKKMKKINVLDLFCGCGGMSWGLEKSKLGFNVVAGVDKWDIALKTYGHNHKDAKAILMDLATVSPKDLLSIADCEPNSVDVIIGGPPCQGFSKNLPASWRFLEDEKNQLYKAYLGVVEYVNPKIVVIENVAEMYNAFDGCVRKEIIDRLKGLGYKVSVKIVNMSTMGIPQKRRRCFFFASRCGEPEFPAEKKILVSAWDAISDLPVVNQGEGYDEMPYTNGCANSYQEHMRASSDSVWNHIANVMSPIQTARIASIGPGQNLKDMPRELQIKRGGYSGAYGRLDYASVAPTITRWVFHIGSGRFAHPREVRGLTMREAARIQSFSDDFHFMGSRNEQAGQIGNAVPPYFMEQMAPKIIDALEYRVTRVRQCTLL